MNFRSRLADLVWKPQGHCLGPDDWRGRDAAALRDNAVAAYVDVSPQPGCDCYVAELAGGKVIGNAKLVATAGDVVLGDVQFLYGAARPESHWVLAQRRLRFPCHLAATAAVLAASNAENYYHWLFDSLPRLHLLELAGYALRDIDLLLLDDSKRAFQLQSLAHMGIAAEKLRHCSKRQVIECDRLIVPSMPGPVGYPPRWLCDFLRDRFVGRRPVAPGRRIYISRQHARGRRLLNEAEILPTLAEHGYEVVHAEQLSFLDQVELFASAEEVISVHGAGMSNIVFAPRGARVLELGSPLHSNQSFRTIADNCDLHHEHFRLEAAAAAGGDTRFANVVADPTLFRRRLTAFSSQS